MTIPGFTARLSLGKASGTYRFTATSSVSSDTVVAQQVCPPGQINCFGQCVTPNPPRNGMSWCGQSNPTTIECPCLPGQTCGAICQGQLCSVDWYCQGPCPPQNFCSGVCVDISSDPQNCGACGNVCPGNNGCQNGVCTCPTGLTLCNGVCVDLTSDPSNCGSCGNTCTGNLVCQNGACTCPPGLSLCNGNCVDLTSDNSNCGSCGNACTAGTCCSSACTDTTSDTMNCGSCGHICPGGCSSCSAGMCVNPSLCATPCDPTSPCSICNSGIDAAEILGHWILWNSGAWMFFYAPQDPIFWWIPRCCSGVISDVMVERDGDIHINLVPDPGCAYLLNSNSPLDSLGRPQLICEIQQWDRGSFPNICGLAVGARIFVCGTWVIDPGHNFPGWSELHPVTSLIILAPPPP